MAIYPSVPRIWTVALFSVSLFAAFILVETEPLQLPAWGLVLAVLVALVFLIPVGVISAVSETTIGMSGVQRRLHGSTFVLGLNVVTEFIAGMLFVRRI